MFASFGLATVAKYGVGIPSLDFKMLHCGIYLDAWVLLFVLNLDIVAHFRTEILRCDATILGCIVALLVYSGVVGPLV